jgi:RecB family endonuclease NucS
MEIYRLEEDDLNRLSEKEMEKEKHLEERLVRAPSAQIGDVEMLYINNQKGTNEGGRFDILGVDEQGDMVIVELKKGAAKREVIAQALEYASKIREADYSYFQ